MVFYKSRNAAQMESKVESITDLTKDVYFGPLLYSYIETILRSGELLEDDFQAVLSVYRTEIFHVKKQTYVPYGLLASTTTLVPSAVAAKKFGSVLFLIPSSVLTTGFVCYTFFQRRKRHNHQLLMERFIQVLKDIQDLNKRIHKYLLERKTHSNKYLREFFQPFTKIVIDFIKALSKKQFDYHHVIISYLFLISEFCDPLKDDCGILKDYQPSNLTDLLQGDLDNYLKYTTDVINVQQLFTSKLLSYLAIIWCYEDSRFNHQNAMDFMDSSIPHLTKLLNGHYQRVQSMFYSLRHAVVRFSEVKLEKRTINKDRISGKLRHALDTSVNNLCFVLEKLFNIIETIEDSDEADRKLIDKGLIDLKSHIGATYEALDILCKLYGILAEPKKTHAITSALEPSTEEEKFYRLQFLDEQDPRELIEDKEKYELYLQATENVEDFSPIYEEASDTYLRLMIKELKQNLYQHEFYVSARERWRDEGDDEEVERLYRTFNRQNSIHEVEGQSISGSESVSGTGSSSEETDDIENDITVKEPAVVSTGSPLSDDFCKKDVVNNHGESLEKVGVVPVQNKISPVERKVPVNNCTNRDTLTRDVENEEKDKWNPILQGVKGIAQSKRCNEETFGDNDDSD